MQRILGIRITAWYVKLAYIIGVSLTWLPILALMNAAGTPRLAESVANAILTLGGILLGARLFRGRGELIAPPRPWWRMTSRPRLSRIVGGLAVAGVVSSLSLFVTAALGLDTQTLERLTIGDTITVAILYAVIAFLYLNSAVRLTRLPAPSSEPKLRPWGRLD